MILASLDRQVELDLKFADGALVGFPFSRTVEIVHVRDHHARQEGPSERTIADILHPCFRNVWHSSFHHCRPASRVP